MLKWLALRDSNPRLADYEPAVLTAELRACKFRGHVGTGTWGQGENTGGPEAQRLGGPERGAWAGKPEGAGFEPAKLIRSLPI